MKFPWPRKPGDFTASFRLDVCGLYNSGIRPDLLVEERGKLRRRASHRIDEVNLRELGPHGRIVQDRYQVLRYPVGDRGINLGVANRPYQTVMLTPPLAVPGPVAGAGLPGILFAGGGLLAWWRRKRKGAALAAA
jgi:hypothetical protein